jgi:hypothetical protein
LYAASAVLASVISGLIGSAPIECKRPWFVRGVALMLEEFWPDLEGRVSRDLDRVVGDRRSRIVQNRLEPGVWTWNNLHDRVLDALETRQKPQGKRAGRSILEG